MTPGENAITAQADPPTCGDLVPAAPPLPQRVGGSTLLVTPAGATQPPADLDLLRRVLGGLKRL